VSASNAAPAPMRFGECTVACWLLIPIKAAADSTLKSAIGNAVKPASWMLPNRYLAGY